jgi:hypothetical protein
VEPRRNRIALRFRRTTMLDAHQDPAPRPTSKSSRPRSSWSPPRRQRRRAPDARCWPTSPRCRPRCVRDDDGNDARRPRSPSARWAGEGARIRFAGLPDGPRVHLAGAGPAAGRRPSAQARRRRDRADPALERRLPLRDLHLAVLPQLPGRGAGAEPDGGAEPRTSSTRDDRRRAVPGRGERAPDHGRAQRCT